MQAMKTLRGALLAKEKTAPPRQGQNWNVDYSGRPFAHNPPWGWMTVLDVLLNNMAFGLFAAAMLGACFAPLVFAAVLPAAFLLAWLFLLLDLVVLIFDLGDPARFHHMLRTLRPLSPMWIGVWALAASSLCMAFPALWGAKLLLAQSGLAGLEEALQAHPALEAFLFDLVLALSLAGLPFAVAGLVYKGVLFSATSRPVWKEGRWFPAYLTNGAVLLGLALFAGLDLWAGAAGFTLLILAMLVPLAVDVVCLECLLHPLLAGRREERRIHMAAACDMLAGLCLPLSQWRTLPIFWELPLLCTGLAALCLAACLGRSAFILCGKQDQD